MAKRVSDDALLIRSTVILSTINLLSDETTLTISSLIIFPVSIFHLFSMGLDLLFSVNKKFLSNAYIKKSFWN